MSKTSIKRKVREFTEQIFDLIGIKVFIRRKDKIFDWKVYDRFEAAHFYQKDPAIQLYHEGLVKTNSEWTDNFSKECRYFSMQQLVRHVLKKGIKGDFVECGCWKGHSAYMIAKILVDHNFQGAFHLFDSFEGGLSKKVEQDVNLRRTLSQQEVKIEKEIFSSTEEEVRRNLNAFPFIKIHAGWIPEILKDFDAQQVAFIHIDVDLYEPTLHSLTFFYEKLVPGGCMAIDDYALSQFLGCQKAVDEFIAKNKYSFFLKHPLGGCCIIK